MRPDRSSWSRSGIGVLLALVGVGVALAYVRATANGLADSGDVRPVATFSEMDPSDGLPSDWEFNPLASAYDETQFDLVHSERGVVLRAQSDSAGAAMGVSCSVDLAEHPILEWRWKIDGVIPDGKADVKARSDLPARLYVTFDYDLSLQNRLKLVVFRAMGFSTVGKRSIGYVWANRMEEDSAFADPYVDWHQLLPVESGTTNVGRWRIERRDVRADYRRLFGEEPPPVKSIGVLTDTEQTGGSVTAYFGDILFRGSVPDSTTHY